MREVVIVSAARTGIGKAFRGSLNKTHGATLAAHVIKHAVERAKIDPAEIEDVVLGCGLPEGATGRPITLDRVAIDFPELTLIGIHVGYPWTEEMISVAWKHPNVYIGTDAYAPRHWQSPLVHFINTWGQDKVLFGTDWPVIDPERAMADVGELELRPEPKQKLLRENALRIFRLPESLKRTEC